MVNGFIEFIEKATTPIQAVSEVISKLKDNGYTELKYGETWNLKKKSKYYVRPYSTTVIAFNIGNIGSENLKFKVVTSHTDSPTFKVKPNPEFKTSEYLKLNTEVYGGPIFNSWYDRPLSMAGQVVLKSEDIYNPKLVEIDFKKPLLIIPSLAIHFNRNVNKGVEVNPQKDMMPLLQTVKKDFEAKNYLINLISKELNCSIDDILDFDLYLYALEKTIEVGVESEFISSPRIDNLSMVYASIEGLINSEKNDSISVAACFDNEEIGSTTKQGADSLLFKNILDRILISLNVEEEERYNVYNRSFVISADGAHAVHPNVVEKNDITNFPIMNSGIAIKISARQSYSTDSITASIFKSICEKAGVNVQYFVNRSDERGGQTLGPISAKYLPIKSVDIGLPMLSMHSVRELMGKGDFEDSIKIFKTFYTMV